MADAPPDLLHCGLVVHGRTDDAEDLLAAFVERLRDATLTVGGLYQVTEPRPEGGKVMVVVDIASGRRIRISQDLGQGSDACCLDPSGLAEAAMILRRAIADRVDLLIVNKFAGREAEGQGLAAETFEALSEGIPVLTLVSDRYLDDWRRLAGEDVGEELAPTLDALITWVNNLPASATSSGRLTLKNGS